MSDNLPNTEWIENVLSSLPFVKWDRYTVGDWNGEPSVSVYGWINREDGYKDFVLVILWPTGDGIYYTTSSDKWTMEIHERLFDEAAEDHNPCHRVEDGFDVENAIELEADNEQ